MKKINVVFCDGSSSLAANAMSFFQEDADICLTLCASGTPINEFSASEVDVVILDTDFIPFRDTAVHFSSRRARVILTSALMREEIEDTLSSINHDALFFKPYSFLEIRAQILKLVGSSAVNVRVGNKSMDEKLSNIFIRAGIPPHIKGYQFLREAVKLSIDKPDMINSITKSLYPSVAKNFNTTPSKVERAIRHAIEVAWNRGKIENINAIFGIKIYGKGEKPTNGELIALIADKMIIESM